MTEQRIPPRKAVTGGIDFYEEIEFPASDEEIITVCLNKLSEINKTQIAGLNSADLPVDKKRQVKNFITGNPES